MRLGVRIQKGDEGVRGGGGAGGGGRVHSQTIWIHCFGETTGGVGGGGRAGGRGDGGRGRALAAAGQPLGSDTATSGRAA